MLINFRRVAAPDVWRIPRRMCIAFLFLFYLSPSISQESLTPDELVALVLERNPNIVSLEAAVAESRARTIPAGALDDPVLSWMAAPDSIGSAIGDRHVVNLSQSIPWPGTLRHRARAATADAHAAQRGLESYRLEVSALARSLFAEWYYTGHAIHINLRARALFDELIGTARTRYTAGRVSQQDVLQAELEQQLLVREGLKLEREAKTIQAAINALINRPAAAVLAVAAVLPPPLVALASETEHPDVLRLSASIEASQERVDLARKAFFPDLRLSAQWNSLWDADEKQWTAGIALNLPLAQGKRRAALDAARAVQQRLEWQRADRKSQIGAELVAARATLSETEQTIALYQEKLIPLASEFLVAARADYRAGAGSFLNVIAAEERLLHTQHALERARADALRAQANVYRWSGADPVLALR